MAQLSRSKKVAAKTLYAALKVLKENGGALNVHELVEKVGQVVELDEWAKERYEKSGYIRWQSILHFHSIGCVKAGFIVKKKGTWYLTPEGEDAIELGEDSLLQKIDEAYRNWAIKRKPDKSDEVSGFEEEEHEVLLDEVEQKAIEVLKKQINAKNAYEFQDLVAALLRAMGYYTPFVAPRGKDGGVDIIAYRDPLGTVTPRIKVQVKHRGQPANVQEIRQLMGLLQKDGDIGIFISTGGFTPDAKTTARSSHIHVELIDMERFISLWQEFYSKLSDEDKKLLPLKPVYFYAPMES